MLNIYNQFRDFHVFKRFKYLFGDWWNMDILVVVKSDKKFFYDNTDQLNNSIVKSLLQSSLFKNYFLGSINAAMNKKAISDQPPKLLSWKQTGLNLFIVPLAIKNTPLEACLVATGFAPKKGEHLYQSLSYLGLSQKAIEQKMKGLKQLSSADEVYIQKMLKILAEECFLILQEKQKQDRLIETLNRRKAYQKYGCMVGKSPAMHYIFNILEKIKDYDTSLLIEGENGTGKRLLAKTIHDQSLRSKKAFSYQNFSDFKGKLLELEIFGYDKQAFPKIPKNKKALLEKIKGGTLFLNEIGNTSPEFQNKLLRFLKEGLFFPEGGDKPKKSDVRVLAATSKDLKTLVEKGQFNKDLYFAINVITIKMPPLKSRKEDIPLLAEHFLQTKSLVKDRNLSPTVIRAFYNYTWPGNIQELESEIEKILSVIPKNQKILTEKDLSPHIRDRSPYQTNVFQPGKQNLKDALHSFERKILSDCLKKHNWNKTRVAKALGISRTSIILKTKEYGIIKEEGA